MSTIVDAIAAAIARQEGYLDANGNVQSGTIAYKNSNPGNLRTWGNLPTASGYAVFPTADQGWAALYRQVQLNIDRGLTLQEFFAGKSGVYGGYAPAADANSPFIYAANVSAWTGIPLGIPLNQLDPNTGRIAGGGGGGSVVDVTGTGTGGGGGGGGGSTVDSTNPFANTTTAELDLTTMMGNLSPEAKIALAVLGAGILAMIVAGR